jgi:CRP/FNR family transcriptional regulator, cyclic AMP receptor protein
MIDHSLIDRAGFPMSAHLQDIIQLLQGIELFNGIGLKDLISLAPQVSRRHYHAGELIFQYGSPGSSMYIVVSGDVNIHIPGDASRRLSLKDISRGEHFGELSLFDYQPRSASAQAMTDVEVIELSRETLLHHIEQHPQMAIAFLQTLSQRLRQTDALLSQRVSKNSAEEFDKQLTWSDRVADKVAELNGSWWFIILLLGITSAWGILNSTYFPKTSFDPYPFEFFNLLLAILVALQGPLIVKSQNRQGLKDRTHARIDYEINLKNEVNIETLLRELGEFRLETAQKLAILTPEIQQHHSREKP